jgi:predicted PurR-regulated permease PerM
MKKHETFQLIIFAEALVLLAACAYQLRILIVILILAVTIASAMAPIADIAERKKIARSLCVVAIYAVLIAIYVLMAIFLAPTVYEQWTKLSESFPDFIGNVTVWLDKQLQLTNGYTGQVKLKPEEIHQIGASIAGTTVKMTYGLMRLIINGVLTLFLAAYFTIEAKNIKESLAKWIPKEKREWFLNLTAIIGKRIGGYVRGQIMVALSVATFLSLGLSLIGVHYAISLGLLAGILNLVPYVGSMITMFFALLVSFNQAPQLALFTFLLFTLEQWLESTVIVPHFLGQEVDLHPLVVMLALICGATLMGVSGALIAVPVAAACLSIAEETYLKNPSMAQTDD